MIYHFILNPVSGKSLKKARHTTALMTEKIRAACQKRMLSYRIYYTTCEGDATEYVRSMVKTSQDTQRFICVGGDGSLNEIVNSAPSNPNVEFGVIPSGTGNDFVKNFDNVELFSDLDAQLDGDTISLDLIKVNDYYCVNMINIGFDCSVVREAAKFRKIKLIPPELSYTLGIVSAFFFKKFGTKMKLVFDDGEIVDDTLMLTAIGNGKFCGGGYQAAPKALLDDGVLDMAIIKKVSRPTFISLIGSYKKGTYLDNPRAMKHITYKQTSHFKMEFDAPVPICIDGEVKGAKTVDFSVVKNGFKFVVPKGACLKYKSEE